MKVKTNIRAGKRSGTELSNSDLGISGGNGGADDTATATTATPAPAPTVYYRCVGV